MIKLKLSSNKPIILANWKMNLSIAKSLALAKLIVRSFDKKNERGQLVLCPSFPALPAVAAVLKGTKIALGAQDVFWKESGPYTGEVSPNVLKELGVQYVIVGHSERRQYLKESDSMIRQKLLAVLASGLTPVLCVGETFGERQSGQTDMVLARQVATATQAVALSPDSRLIVAYEPVWVIGSGQAVEPAEAVRAAQVINHSLLEVWSASTITKQVNIIYGGSVNAYNTKAFVGAGHLDGLLVGGSSLEFAQFAALLKQL